jgi:hypothetical protein
MSPEDEENAKAEVNAGLQQAIDDREAKKLAAAEAAIEIKTDIPAEPSAKMGKALATNFGQKYGPSGKKPEAPQHDPNRVDMHRVPVIIASDRASRLCVIGERMQEIEQIWDSDKVMAELKAKAKKYGGFTSEGECRYDNGFRLQADIDILINKLDERTARLKYLLANLDEPAFSPEKEQQIREHLDHAGESHDTPGVGEHA